MNECQNPRSPWAPSKSCDLVAVLGLDDDNQPALWLGVYPKSHERAVTAATERNGYTPCIIPLRVNLPEVRGDLKPFSAAGTADVELTQVTFSVVDYQKVKRAGAARRKPRKIVENPTAAAAKGGER